MTDPRVKLLETLREANLLSQRLLVELNDFPAKGSRVKELLEHIGRFRYGDRLLLSPVLDDNLALFEDIFRENSQEAVFRRFRIGRGPRAALLFLETLADKQLLMEHIVRPLMKSDFTGIKGQDNLSPIIETITENILVAPQFKESQDVNILLSLMLTGQSLLLVDGSDKGLALNLLGFPKRSLSQPPSSTLIRGPRDGFIENIETNLSLVRRRIKDPNLVFKTYLVGRRSQTRVAVGYIKGLTSPDIVNEVDHRLRNIDIDSVLESGYIEQMIEDNWRSPFPQTQASERPDQVAAEILEGRVAIFVDTTPFVLLVPATFDSLFKVPEDYYTRWLVGSMVRSTRFIATGISIFLPALYIAVVSFHPGMMPTILAISVAQSREGIPFPAFVEAFAMIVTLEILRETGLRLPAPIGQTIGVVGGLVIGQAAVQAGLISPLMIIVVAATAIASFAIPSFEMGMVLRLLIFAVMVLASLLGLFGITIGFIILAAHLVSLRSFGLPYTSPWAPVTLADWKDALVRAPWPAMHRRPLTFDSMDLTRMQDQRKDGLDSLGEEGANGADEAGR